MTVERFFSLAAAAADGTADDLFSTDLDVAALGAGGLAALAETLVLVPWSGADQFTADAGGEWAPWGGDAAPSCRRDGRREGAGRVCRQGGGADAVGGGDGRGRHGRRDSQQLRGGGGEGDAGAQHDRAGGGDETRARARAAAARGVRHETRCSG